MYILVYVHCNSFGCFKYESAHQNKSGPICLFMTLIAAVQMKWLYKARFGEI